MRVKKYVAFYVDLLVSVFGETNEQMLKAIIK